MGRFSEESHTDLREWYIHCLDFRTLKRRLIDDPPDPFDDHPSMMGAPSPMSSAAANGAAGQAACDGSSGSGGGDDGDGALFSAAATDAEDQQALLMAEGQGVGGGRRAAGEAAATATEARRGRERHGWSRRPAAGEGRGDGLGISLGFPDPASRAFVFEINEELERMWAFYRGESEKCASKLGLLHDSSAYFRHRLHRKLGGAVGEPAVDTRGGGGAVGCTGISGAFPPASVNAPTASLLDDEDLQYRSPVNVSAGGVLRPTPQEHLMESGMGVSGARIRGRKSAANLQLGEEASASSGWSSPASTPLPPATAASLLGGVGGHDVDRGTAKANALAAGGQRGSGGGGGGGGGGFDGGDGKVAGVAGAGAGADTTEDPYVQASLKRSIVELYDTCHRLLSFKMLNYDAFIRLIELHCRRSEGSSSSAHGTAVGGASYQPLFTGKMAAVGDGDGGEAGGAVGGGGAELSAASAVAGTRETLTKEKAMKVWLLKQPLFSSRGLNRTLAGAELLYASLFCNGDVDVARTALTFKASSALRGNRRFDFGYRLGAACVLLVWAMWDCIADDSLGKDVWHDPAFRIYRGLGNLVLLVYMWGVNIWVWRRFGIDYERCLSLDPKGPRVDPCEQVWNAGCNLSIAFLTSFICFYKCLRGVLLNPVLVPIQFAHTFPLLLLFYVLLCFLTPWNERKELLRVLWTTIISPFGQVRFLEGYVGDILTSVVRVLIDVAFAFLYFLSGVRGWLGNSLDLEHDPISDDPWFKNLLVPLLMVAPLWWRFQQNLRRSYETRQRWPHLGNALKYATAMSVSLFGTFQPQMHSSFIWVFCFVGATLYQFTWDVVMDWDLLRWDARSLRFRPRLLYRNKNLYFSVALVNLLLRFLWTVTLVPENAPNLFPHDFQIYFSPFVAAAEIVRRTMWGFLRVENEHLRIYGGHGDGADTDLGGEGFKHVHSCGTVSTMAGGSINSSMSSSDSVGGGGGGHSSGLDRLPYSRMEMPSSSSSGGLLRRLTIPIKAWCLVTVKRESRCRLLTELCLFSAALVSVGFLAGLS